MTSRSVYFKQDVLVEPLFNQWHARSNLIPPDSSVMYIANSHIKIMESFVAAPQAHVSALKNPAMPGLRLISRLRESFQVEIPLGHLFESQTVLHLSQPISQKVAQKETPDAMIELLAELDGLSEEEALRQLDSGAL